MIAIYAAVDIMAGRCVRLRRGAFDESTDYGDPVEVACQWESHGADWLHVVDLDGAAKGALVNAETVQAILERVSIPVQLGGGLRRTEAIEAVLDSGCARVVIGSAALADPAWAEEVASRWPDRLVVALDVREGRVRYRGWTEDAGLTLKEAFEALAGVPFAAAIVTDITRDGMMAGIEPRSVEGLVEQSPWPVIVSGGVASAEDAEALASLARSHPKGDRLCGLIVGRALYEGAVTIAELKTALEG